MPIGQTAPTASCRRHTEAIVAPETKQKQRPRVGVGQLNLDGLISSAQREYSINRHWALSAVIGLFVGLALCLSCVCLLGRQDLTVGGGGGGGDSRLGGPRRQQPDDDLQRVPICEMRQEESRPKETTTADSFAQVAGLLVLPVVEAVLAAVATLAPANTLSLVPATRLAAPK